MTATGITWLDLVERDPELGAILWEAMMSMDDKRKKSFCARRIWDGGRGRPGLKDKLSAHVGWSAATDDPVLKSTEAYEISVQVVFGALPPCRNCGCE